MNAVLFEKDDFKLELVEGNVVASFKMEGLAVVATVDSVVGIDKLKELIPGPIDDVVLEILKGALKA